MKTKVFLAILSAGVIFSACKNEKADEQKQQAEILKVHEKAMNDGETAVRNKSKLDSLVKKFGQDTSRISEPKRLSNKLESADEAMENWMHQFNPDYTGKSHTEVMEYLHSQRLQLLKVDSLLTVANAESEKYLLTVK